MTDYRTRLKALAILNSIYTPAIVGYYQAGILTMEDIERIFGKNEHNKLFRILDDDYSETMNTTKRLINV